MFTGLIEACVPVLAWTPSGTGGVLQVAVPEPSETTGEPWDPSRGESIAVCGCCLTVSDLGTAEGGRPTMSFELSSETLDKTWFGALEPGKGVNLERSVRLADRLGGHLVSGHVDGRGSVHAIEDSGDGGQLFTFEVEPGFERYLIEKGSVSVEGISLTVVDPRERLFDVAIIPETLARTNLGTIRVGERVHLEADQIGKWVEKLLEARS